MSRQHIVSQILASKNTGAACVSAQEFAPSNIALIKYWGKRDSILNLPITDSLSLSLGSKGATTKIAVVDGANSDTIYLNGKLVDPADGFARRIDEFLDLFRQHTHSFYKIETQVNIPVASGLASSACGFAALVMAINSLYNWQLTDEQLSILARLGSGSAARSIWQGFVHWHMGEQADGSDSYAEKLDITWPGLCFGLVILDSSTKAISSRVAMQTTIETSHFYKLWPTQVDKDMQDIMIALKNHDFVQLGTVAERNAIAMHATMHTSWPPIMYHKPDTIKAMQAVWELRKNNIPVYFTQDAGPNIKLLFEKNNYAIINDHLSKLNFSIDLVQPFV